MRNGKSCSRQSFSNNMHFNRFVGKTWVFSEREQSESHAISPRDKGASVLTMSCVSQYKSVNESERRCLSLIIQFILIEVKLRLHSWYFPWGGANWELLLCYFFRDVLSTLAPRTLM